MPGNDSPRPQRQPSIESFTHGTPVSIVELPPKKPSPKPPLMHVKRRPDEADLKRDDASPSKVLRAARRDRNVAHGCKNRFNGYLKTPPKQPLKGSVHSPRAYNHEGSHYSALVKMSAAGRTLTYLGRNKREHYDYPSTSLAWSTVRNIAVAKRTLTTEPQQINCVNITLDLIDSIQGRQHSDQEAVMKGTAVWHLLNRGFSITTPSGEVLKTAEDFKKHLFGSVWLHVIADRLGGKTSPDNLMAGSESCNMAERMITDALIQAMKHHKCVYGKKNVGRWELTVVSDKVEVTGTKHAKRQFWKNIAHTQVYSYVYVDAKGNKSEPLAFTLFPLDPNPTSFTNTRINFESMFADVMAGRPLFDTSQSQLPRSSSSAAGSAFASGGRALFSPRPDAAGAASAAGPEPDDSALGTSESSSDDDGAAAAYTP